MKMYNYKAKPVLLASRHLGSNKTGFNLSIVHFYIRGKLFIIRCDIKIPSLNPIP